VPAFYAFTGSTEVGLHIRRTVGLRPAQLELGSLASTIVCADADLASCVPKVTAASFRKAGQVCTSVQRLYVERAVLPEFVAAMREQLAGRGVGDPLAPATFIGPVISIGDAERIKRSVDEAIDQGATLLLGGGRKEALVEPTVLTDVTTSMDVMTRETFGPVVSIRPFDDYEAALAEADDTPYGLAAGIFTRDIDRALAGASRLRMGSVHINETSNSRLDLMPFGGVKASGSGKEGPHHAIREMTEERLITISPSSAGPLSEWDF
jgi:succinate-semialdehyde dehydrogenase/glutarate-semialdehyde dehydrogenase